MADSTPLTSGARYVYGQAKPVDVPIDTATAVVKGDIVCISSGKCVPATAFATRALAAAAFLGIAAQSKEAGVAQIRGNGRANTIVVNTGGFFAIPCVDACDVTDKVGIKLNGGATAALANEVSKTATANEQIGVVAEIKTASESHVVVEIFPKVFGPRSILV